MNKEYIKAFWNEFKKGNLATFLFQVYKVVKIIFIPIALLLCALFTFWAGLTHSEIAVKILAVAIALEAIFMIYADIKTAKEVADIVVGKKKYCHWYKSAEPSEPNEKPFKWESCNGTNHTQAPGEICPYCEKEIRYHFECRPE